MKSLGPEEENFFTLTQLKAAKYPVFEENLEYTKKVLVSKVFNKFLISYMYSTGAKFYANEAQLKIFIQMKLVYTICIVSSVSLLHLSTTLMP